MQKYLWSIVPHSTTVSLYSHLDTFLRVFIGKVDDNKQSVCSHDAIIRREISGKDPEKYCRVCSRNLNVNGIGRCNDFLFIRNRECKGPICIDCFKNKPDKFYNAYKKGLKKYKMFTKALAVSENELEELDNFIDKLK